MARTVGISPKVKLPTGVLAGCGVVLVVLGYILGEPDVTSAGWTALGASGVTGFLGFHASPGLVR